MLAVRLILNCHRPLVRLALLAALVLVVPLAAAPLTLTDATIDPAYVRIGGVRNDLRGTADPGAKVIARRDGVIVGQGVADAKGAWSFHLDLADGGWRLTLTAGETTRNITVEVDNTPPYLQLVSPAPTDDVETPTFSLTARTAPGAKVELRTLDRQLSATPDAAGFFTFKDLPLKDGANRFALVLTDDLGNAAGYPFAVLARLAPPHVAILHPVAGPQTSAQLDLETNFEAGCQVVATVDGRALTVKPEPLPGRFLVAREVARLGSFTFEPGSHELIVTATSPSGARTTTLKREFTIPGPPRTLTWKATPAGTDRGGQSSAMIVQIKVCDPWGAPVADGVKVGVDLPRGWTTEGGATTAATKNGAVNFVLRATMPAPAGRATFTCGTVSESMPIALRWNKGAEATAGR